MYTVSLKSENVLRELTHGKLASFYFYADKDGREAGIVARKASNENANTATRLGQAERKEKGLKQFCRGIVLCEEDRTLVFVRYKGNLTAKRMGKILNLRMGRDTSLKATLAKRLKSCRTENKQDMDARASEAGTFEAQLKTTGGVDLAASVEVEDDDGTGTGRTASYSALLAELEEGALSQESYEAEILDAMRETLTPISEIIGASFDGVSSLDGLARVFLASTAHTTNAEIARQILASEGATKGAYEVLSVIGEGRELGAPGAEAEFEALSGVLRGLESDISAEIGFDAYEPEKIEPRTLAEELSGQSADISEARLYLPGGGSQMVRTAQKLRREMTWTPRRAPDTALPIRPFHSRNLQTILDRIQAYQDEIVDIIDDRTYILPADAAGFRARIAAATAQAVADIDGVMAPLYPEEDPVVVIRTRDYNALNLDINRFRGLVKKAERRSQETIDMARDGDPVRTREALLRETLATTSPKVLAKHPTGVEALCRFIEENPTVDGRAAGALDEYPPCLRALTAERDALTAALESGEPVDVLGTFERFIATGSPQEVNLPHTLREQVTAFFGQDGFDGIATTPEQKRAVLDLFAKVQAEVTQVATDGVGSAFRDHVAGAYAAYITDGSAGPPEEDIGVLGMKALADELGLTEPHSHQSDRLGAIDKLIEEMSLSELAADDLVAQAIRTFLERSGDPISDDVPTTALLLALDRDDFLRLLRDSRDTYEAMLARTGDLDAIGDDVKLYRDIYVHLGETAGLKDPTAELRTVRDALERDRYRQTLYRESWERCRAEGRAFLAAPPKHAFIWGISESVWESRPMMAFSSTTASPRDDVMGRLLPEESTASVWGGECAFYTDKKRKVLLTPAPALTAMRELDPSWLVVLVSKLDTDEDVIKRQIIGELMLDLQLDELLFPEESDSPYLYKKESAGRRALSAARSMLKEAPTRTSPLAEAFRLFSEKVEFSEENTTFLREVRPLIKQLRADVRGRDTALRVVKPFYDRFLAPGASTRVNINHNNKNALEPAYTRHNANLDAMFKHAQDPTLPAAPDGEVVAAKDALATALEGCEREIADMVGTNVKPRFVARLTEAWKEYKKDPIGMKQRAAGISKDPISGTRKKALQKKASYDLIFKDAYLVFAEGVEIPFS